MGGGGFGFGGCVARTRGELSIFCRVIENKKVGQLQNHGKMLRRFVLPSETINNLDEILPDSCFTSKTFEKALVKRSQ